MKTYAALAAVQGVLLAFQGISYLLIQRIQGNYHDMMCPADCRIPLRTGWVYLYILWYPLIALYPLCLYGYSAALYRIYLLAIILDILVSLLIYAVYPTSFQRPSVSHGSFTGKILRSVYTVDYKGLNCMPSMHCSQCFIIMASVGSAASGGIAEPFALCGVFLLALFIVASTLFTKQHVVIDVITALPVGIGCYILSALALAENL